MDHAELGLQELLFNRVVADPTLPARCKDLLVAAFDSDQQVDEGTWTRQRRGANREPLDSAG